MATGNTITTSTGQTYNYDDVVNLILSRYAEGKTPALAVKSALQLGFPEDVIRTLPGVDAAAFEEGKRLIQSGAFTEQATGTMADIQQAAPVGSAQYNARIAAGLDAFGFPPEEVARLTAQGLYGPGKKYDPGPSPELYYSPENERESGGLMTSNVPGRTLYAPTAQELQNTLADISSTASQEAMQSYGPNTLENALTTAIVGAITGGLLGPAGLGLSQPVAAGIGGAAGTAATGADRNQILLGALLAGGSAYGLGELSSTLNQSAYDLSFAAADAAQLANQGLDAAAIAQNLSTYVDPTVANSLANTARNAFLTLPEGIEGVSPSDVVSDLNFQPTRGTSTQLPTLPDSVEVPGQRITGNLFDITPSSVGGVLYDLLELRGISSPIPGAGTQQVQVQGQGLPQTQATAQEVISAVAPAAVSAVPTATGGTQQVEVPGTRTVKTNENIISSLVPALTTAAVPAAAQAVTQPTGTQQVEVTTQRNQPLLPTITPPVIAAIPALPAGLTAELPKPLEPTQKADEKSLFSPSDILKLIGLLGGAGAGAALSQAGTGTVSTPPSDTLIGTTTPQFGPDYYAAVQRYYNAYMPETPRNVATPLQQWYENKFGA